MARTFAQQERRRKKWITGLVLASLAASALTVTLAYVWSRAGAEKPAPVLEALPTNVGETASGYSFTRSVAGRRIFTVHAARTVAFKEGGGTVLEDVMVELFGREGNRHDVLRTRQCEYNPKTGDLSSAGKVAMQLSAPTGAGSLIEASMRRARPSLFLETSNVSFKHEGSLVATKEPVSFRFGTATGSAQGLKYATQDGWLELERDVILELRVRGGAPYAAEPAPIRLVSSHLRYESPRGGKGVVKLDGPIEVVQASRRVLADRGTVFLDARSRITGARLDENVRAFDSSPAGALEGRAKSVWGDFEPATGQLRSIAAEGDVMCESRRNAPRQSSSRLEARQLEIVFQGAHPQPRSGTASGDVRITLESPALTAPPSEAQGSPPANERKRLTAAQVKFKFRPAGNSLSEMVTVGAGKIVLEPADPIVGRREITAGRFLMFFDKRNHLETLRGLPPTRVLFQPARNAPPGASPKESSSESLTATFDPDTQMLAQVDQTGAFKFREGDREGKAERATYLASTQVFTLIGHPEVWDADTRIRAERVFFDLRSDRARGEGKVQSTQFGTPRDDPADATHVLADRMLAERPSQLVHYEGHVRAWHGADVVESAALEVARNQRRVSSGSAVLTSHFQPAAPENGGTSASQSGKAGGARPVTIRADRLDYLDAGRKASYHGNVLFQAENTAIKSDRLDVYFSALKSPAGSEVERAVANGHVTVIQPARHANGEHAEYEAAPGKIQLTGGPPTLVDAEKGSTTGQRLTFFVRDDRLMIDGGDQFPSLSKHRVAQ